MAKTQFNGEIKAVFDAAKNLDGFREKHIKVFTQLETLQGVFNEAEKAVKDIAKARVKIHPKNKKFELHQGGVLIKAWASFSDKFDISGLSQLVLEEFHAEGLLTVDVKAYQKLREEGGMPKETDTEIRIEVLKSVSAKVEI